MLSYLRSQSISARVGYGLLFAVALLSVIRHAWPDANYFPVDFKYFWLAGSLWAEGVSPYGAELQTLGKELFPGERINPFFYPPNWRFLAELLAATPPDLSESIWAALSAAALLGFAWVSALIGNHLYPGGLSLWRIFVLSFAIVGGGSHAVEISIQIGQPAPFLLLAVTALLYTALKPSKMITAAAIAILLLKPQLGIPVAFACMFIPSMRVGLMIGVAITGALALYGLGSAPLATFSQFLANISIYGSLPENTGLVTSGPSFLLTLSTNADISAFIWLGFATAAIAVAVVYARQAGPIEEALAARIVFFAMAAALFFMPTHNFDFLVMSCAIVLVWGYGRPIVQLAGVGVFLTMRSMSLSIIAQDALFADKTVNVTLFDTIGSALIFAAAGALIYVARKQPATTQAASAQAETASTIIRGQTA